MLASRVESFGRFVAFSFAATLALPAALLRPLPLLVQIERFIGGATPIALVVGAAVGLVAWMHLGGLLARFDGAVLLPTVLLLAVATEFGPVSVGLVAASRLSSGVAAELAAMNNDEQLDALRCLGVSPLHRLIAPRILAAMFVLPPLTVAVDYAALLGGFAAETLGGGLPW
ncbi:MAG: MlaE family ABC transporter permease, partial [Planctomycetia bacterium]